MFTKIKITLPLGLFLAALFASFEKGNYLLSFLPAALIFFLGISALYALWVWTGKPRPLIWIVTLALLLRLASAIALQIYLPINGYPDSEQQQSGYVFFDAFRRDTEAWQLAESAQPLISAFSKEYHTDQYGGLLAFSAGVYRYLSPDEQRPLLIVFFSALAAALGIPFFWLAAKDIGGEKLALPATWIFALYPESILLGSSQMREPFLISLVALSLWAFLTWQKDKKDRAAQISLGIGFTLMLLISPAIAFIMLLFLGIYALLLAEKSKLSLWHIGVFLVILLVSIFWLSYALGQTKLNANSPLGIIAEWTQRAVQWDIYQLERGSGWIQKLFAEMPAILHIPFVTAYGLTQPVLPAALMEPTTLIWRILAILRAVGWYILAPFLLYGLFAISKTDSPLTRRIWMWFGLGSWSWIILASLRAGGDQWDNPRYRVIFLALQAICAAWAWTIHRERRGIWLPRILTVEVIFLAFFTHWYASRYYARFGTLSFGAMVMWIVILTFGVILDGVIRSRKNGSAANLVDFVKRHK